MSDLVVGSDGAVYFLANDGTSNFIKHVNSSGQVATLTEFESGVAVKKISWYDSMIYCLVNNKLNVVDPAGGEMDEVCPLALTEYVIIDDVIFYVSGDDVATYTKEMSDGNMLVASSGKLYSMTSTGSNSELLLDKGRRRPQGRRPTTYTSTTLRTTTRWAPATTCGWRASCTASTSRPVSSRR